MFHANPYDALDAPDIPNPADDGCDVCGDTPDAFHFLSGSLVCSDCYVNDSNPMPAISGLAVNHRTDAVASASRFLGIPAARIHPVTQHASYNAAEHARMALQAMTQEGEEVRIADTPAGCRHAWMLVLVSA